MGIYLMLAVMLVSITKRFPGTKRLSERFSSGMTTLALAGIVLLLVAGSASAGEQGGIGCVNSTGWAYQCGDTVTESCTFNGDLSCESV
jgi:hypothetical protein